MKVCKVCGAKYIDRISFCFNDGAVLETQQVASPLDVMDTPMPGAGQRRGRGRSLLGGRAATPIGGVPRMAAPDDVPEPQALAGAAVQAAPVVTFDRDFGITPFSTFSLRTAPWRPPENLDIDPAEAPTPIVERPDPPDEAPAPPPTAAELAGDPADAPEREPMAHEAPPAAAAPSAVDGGFDPAPAYEPEEEDDLPPPPPPAADTWPDEEIVTRGGGAPVWLVPVAAVVVLALLGIGGLMVLGGVIGTAAVGGKPTAAAVEPAATKQPPPPPEIAAPPPEPPVIEEPPVEEPPVEEPPAGAPDASPAVVAPRNTGKTITKAAQITPPTETTSPWTTTEPAVTVSQVRIISIPAGAEVVVDGKPRGPTPLKIELPYGSHKVELALDGFQPGSRNIEVSTESMQVPIELKANAKTGIVMVFMAGRDGDTLLVDGRSVGKLPVRATLPEGEHVFAVEGAAGPFQVTRAVVLNEGGATMLNLAAP